MSPGKRGFKKLGLDMDVYSQHLSVRKLKTAATAEVQTAIEVERGIQEAEEDKPSATGKESNDEDQEEEVSEDLDEVESNEGVALEGGGQM
jgi:hypothetical protein